MGWKSQVHYIKKFKGFPLKKKKLKGHHSTLSQKPTMKVTRSDFSQPPLFFKHDEKRLIEETISIVRPMRASS